MIAAVRDGRDGTAMRPFRGILSDDEIAAVVDYVRDAFMVRGDPNTRYHTVENGWPDHERHRDAFPFATGELAVDAADGSLTPAQRRGKALFLATCVSCHDRGRVNEEGPVWQPGAVSYPRAGFGPGDYLEPSDALTGATVFDRHDRAPELANPTPAERRGERLFQDNCAFCHAPDGTGRNWIGTFLEPNPRDLTDPTGMASMTWERFTAVVAAGVAGTSMPAWRGVLAPDEIEAIAAYVHRAFHPLAGEPPLSSRLRRER
jgi:cytochrome c oxidase cbb3-type subunit 3